MTKKAAPLQTLDQAVEELVTSPHLLLATDFDGTISPILDSPDAVRIDPVAAVALRQLSELPNTDVVVVSGRGLSDLAKRFEGLPRVRLVGSHGGEFDQNPSAPLTASQLAILAAAREIATSISLRYPGSRIEEKPHAIAFHYRSVDPAFEVPLVREVERAFSAIEGGFLRTGSKVFELSASKADKGQALKEIQYQTSPTATIFLGDDRTDEDAFRALAPGDVTVKIGPGETAARFRVKTPEEAIRIIARISEERAAWLRSVPETLIDTHTFLSDLRTFAIVDDHASLVWFCAPALDGAPVFGSLVGGPASGSFSIDAPGPVRQEYIENTCVCVTRFGETSVTDFLDCSSGRPFQRAGRTDFIRVFSGPGPVTVEFAPKLDFGRLRTRLVALDGGLKVEGGPIPIVLRSPGWSWEIVRVGAHDVARSTHRSPDGVFLELSLGTGSLHKGGSQILQRQQDTERFWRAWVGSLKVPDTAKKEVTRSALVLRALSYGPTGAIAAAGTTSLPETLGGVRNWDYRFCWPRDAAMAAHALARIGAPGPGMRLLDWVLGTLEGCEEGGFLRPVYTVTGRHLFGEAEVAEAIGYRGSRPVRVGNLAAQQLQLDSLGPVALLLVELARRECPLSPDHLSIADKMVALIKQRWKDPDHGIWEIRSEQRHYVHSKLMCWQTVNCSIEVAEYLGLERPEWFALREEIRADIEEHGFNNASGAYKAAYSLDAPDAALLWVVLSGFHEPEHPRAARTVEYVMQHLLREGSVYRYFFNDALSGHEGTFHICTAWLIEALVMMGRKAEALELFETFRARIGPTGLLSEQWDTEQNIALGNFPQAYSHLGLINSAWALSSYER